MMSPTRPRLLLPPLCPIVNLDTCRDALRLALGLIDAGAAYLQIRGKKIADPEFIEVVRRSVRHSAGRTRIIVNDRTDICLIAGADGVHLGQDDVPPAAVRKLVGEGAIIGFSTHNLEQIECAPAHVVDYLGFGPVFKTSTKDRPSPTVGVSLLAKAIKRSSLPLVAIGGIERSNAASVYAAGALSVAVVRDLEGCPDVGAVLRDYSALAALPWR